jgi:hypothetical protein
VTLFVLLFCANGALAAPLDLRDPTPRWIEICFEVSPADAPGQLDAVWSGGRRAYLDQPPGQTTIRIRVPAEEIEAQLRANGSETIPGSFSDFVWHIDPRTGHVLQAAFSGRIRERISLGFFRASTLVDIRVEMTTIDPAGFRKPKGLFGLKTHFYCTPSAGHPECIAVESARFNLENGYVNAIGSVHATTTIARIRAFSPLGEVQFSERGSWRVKNVVSSTSLADGMVCSMDNDGPCLADLGGES